MPSPKECRGAGLGLRLPHIRQVCREQPDVPWFEVHICNYLGGGLNRTLLRAVGERYALSFHGVNLNLGGVDALDSDYLRKLRCVVDELQPALVSEHACFCRYGEQHFHDLMPVPYTDTAVRNMAQRIRQVQDTLGRQILIENVSRYFRYDQSALGEAEFLRAVCDETDCGLLLDLHNAWVNQCNLGEDLDTFLACLPLERVQEVHLAGGSVQGGQLIDTHSSAPSEALWRRYARFCELYPQVPCLIEWDSQLPAFAELHRHRGRAQAIMDSASVAATHERYAG